MKNCNNASTITATANAYGICYNNKGTITDCNNVGDVTASTRSTSAGLCSVNEGSINGCYNTGKITGCSLGGISYYNNGTISNCYNTGTITGGNNYNIGGISGQNCMTLTNCYNTGNVTGGADSYIGGICGYNINCNDNDSLNGTITKCYNTGTVTNGTDSNTKVKGICAMNTDYSEINFNNDAITDCYYKDTSETDSLDGTTFKTETQFKSGEVCYLLNKDQTTIYFYQTLNTDNLPVLDNTHKTVYKDGENYTNTKPMEKGTLTKDNFKYTAPTKLTYNGAEKSAIVKANTGVECGEITVKYYKGDILLTSLPVDAGNYTVKIDVAESAKYKAITDLVIDSFTIDKKALKSNDITISEIPEQYYTSEKIEPNFTVNYGDTFLQKGVDYNVVYGDNTEVGKQGGSLDITLCGNYCGTASKKFDIVFKQLPADKTAFTVPTPSGENGWYKEDFFVTATDGYTVSEDLPTTDIRPFAKKIKVTFEANNRQKYVYIKDNDGNYYVDSFNYSLDKNVPTEPQIEYNQSGLKAFLNKATFGLLFKNSVTVNAKATDNQTDDVKVEYYAADSAVTDTDTITDWENSLSLTPNSKKIVYVKFTDDAGNYIIAKDQGVIVYTDSDADTESIEFTKTTTDDVIATVTLNGNTIKDIKNGDYTLVKDTDYTVNGNQITFTSSYLDTLQAGDYTFTVSYNPMGEDVCAGESSYSTSATALNVTATSNLFPTATKSFSADKKKITVTYFFESEKDVLESQWIVTYDKNVLKVSAENWDDGLGSYTFMPQVTSGQMYNPYTDGIIRGYVSDLKLYKFDTRKPYVSVTFDVIGSGNTTVDLNVEYTTVSKIDPDTNYTDLNEEVELVNNSDVIENPGVNTTCDTIVYEGVLNPNKQPETNNPADSVVGELPNTTDIALTVKKAEGSVTNIPDLSKEYDKQTVSAPTFDKLGTGNAMVEYKLASDADSEYVKTAPYKAGNYTVRVTVDTDENYLEAIATKNFSISKRELTISGTTVESTKVYDGNATATITSVGTLSNKISSDNVYFNVGKANYSDKNVGTAKEVTFTGYYIAGIDNANYTLKDQPQNTTANITKRNLDVDLSIKNKQYDGLNIADYDKTPTLVGTVLNDVVTLTNGVPTFSSVTVGTSLPIELTAFSISGKDANNYSLTQPTATADIYNNYDAKVDTDYTVNSNDWINTDFVVTAKKDYKLSLTDTADGDWKDTLEKSEETANGEITFYVKNVSTNSISKAVAESYKIDKTAPIISGIENNSEYYTTQNATVSDDNIKIITLNGTVCTEQVIIDGNDDKNYTLIVTDKAGNETTYNVTMKAINNIAKAIENITSENVKTLNRDDILNVMKSAQGIDTTNATDDEKKELNDIAEKCNQLLDTIKTISSVLDDESIKAVENITKESIKLSDKTSLYEAKEFLENALNMYTNNYTKEEKDSLEIHLKEVYDLIMTIDNSEKTIDIISKLPTNDSIKLSDKASIESAKEAYEKLTDTEKKLVGIEYEKQLEDAINSITRLEKQQTNDSEKSQETGDSMNTVLAISILAISGGLFVFLSVNKKRKVSK